VKAGRAFLAYLILSLVLTWPVVRGLGSDVPGDLGDSLLNMWILAWGAEHVPKLLIGAIGWSEFWNANIFHPDPLALALSEHLFGQTLQILPVYWLTGNIILCYNLLFISTFALSGLGAYLLVRDLTGDTRAAFIAGLVYGFLPYRIASVPHLQVLSSQWMPFALWGLNRFVTRLPAPGSPPPPPEGGYGATAPKLAKRAKAGPLPAYRALALGTGALVLQNWSCGYYMLYFTPFVPLFVIHRMWTLGTLRTVRTWVPLGAAALATAVLSLPFLLPYREAQLLFGIERPFGEVVRFSANAWSYLTASENLNVWGRALRLSPRPEGETFLGVMPWLLTAFALVALLREPSGAPARAGGDGSFGTERIPSGFSRGITWLLIAATVTQFIALAAVVLFGGFEFNLFGMPIRARTPMRMVFQFVTAAGLLLAVSPRMRSKAALLARSPVVFFFLATVIAIWLSMGPMPIDGDGRASGFGIYGGFYHYVPGFNGLRVPARYAMIAGLFLAILAGFGTRALLDPPKPGELSRGRRRTAMTVIAALILLEGAAVPIETNRTWAQNEAMPPARVMTGAHVPPVYARIAALPAGAVVTEFPFGDAAWEIRYVYYAAAHWKPITNGYSGVFPQGYKERVARLQRVPANPDASWQTLRDSGTTHVVIHRNAFGKVEDAGAVEAWLKSHGAIELERYADGDILLSVRFN
jgi:hypothetical protein